MSSRKNARTQVGPTCPNGRGGGEEKSSCYRKKRKKKKGNCTIVGAMVTRPLRTGGRVQRKRRSRRKRQTPMWPVLEKNAPGSVRRGGWGRGRGVDRDREERKKKKGGHSGEYLTTSVTGADVKGTDNPGGGGGQG